MRGWIAGLGLVGCVANGHGPAPAEVVVVPEQRAEVAAPVVMGEQIEIVCAREVRCGKIGRSELAECRKGPGVSRLTRVWGYDEMLGIPGSIAQGRATIKPAADRECFAYLQTGPCKVDAAHARAGCFGGVMAFRRLAPAVPVGGMCERSEECVGGFCTAQPGCPGVCVATAKIGATCGAWQLCEAGAYCFEETCVARGVVGAQCHGNWQSCADGLLCDGYRAEVESHHDWAPEMPGKCSERRQVGEVCGPASSFEQKCRDGLVCDWGVDVPVCGERKPQGVECRWDDACGDGLECMGLVLGGVHPAGGRFGVRRAGRCTPTLDAGDGCDPLAFVSGCATTMVCDRDKRVCRSSGHAGDACESSWVTKPHPADEPLRTEGCVSGHFCEVATRTCKRQVLRGEACVPQEFGVEDSPCFLGKCDEKTRRCAVTCAEPGPR